MNLGILVEPTRVTLPDGTTVLVDDLGRVVVPRPPSAWDIFWRDPGGEIREATGRVFSGVGRTAGAAAGDVVAGTADSFLDTLVDRLGPLLWIGLGVVAIMALRQR